MEKSEIKREEITKRVEENSRKLDKETAGNRFYLPEEIKKWWKRKKWKIKNCKIEAIGVCHVPETFLEYREEIETAIAREESAIRFYNDLAKLGSNMRGVFTNLAEQEKKHKERLETFLKEHILLDC